MNLLLDQLQHDGVITEDQARVVRIECASRQVLPGTVLLQSHFVTADVLSGYADKRLSLALNAAEFVPDESALLLIEERTARRFCALPLSLNQDDKQLLVLLDDLRNVVARDTIRREVPDQIKLEFRESNTADIKQALDKCYGHSYSLAAVLLDIEQQSNSQSAPTSNNADKEPTEAPIVRLIDTLLQDAVTRRASDIHLSPTYTHVQIRYRIDGVLQNICCLHVRYWPAMLVRIKVLSDLDIAETRLPQDGHLSRIIHGVPIDFRVASFPLRSSENLVLRVLDRRRGLMGLSVLCNDRHTEQTLTSMMDRPSGLVLVCGPTGAGKTTTLYALLGSLNAQSLNIMTLEDPVEYPLAKVRQTRVNGNSALGFAEGVRGVLRQDPDVILVGEVRDSESCHMTCRAALTGHLVLSSTHADSAINGIGRLLELGVSRSLLASVLTGVVSQRLIRKVCQHCYADNPDCRVCFGSGYNSRLALFECLSVSAVFASALASGEALSRLQQLAVEEGMVPLDLQARDKVTRGQTTQQEIIRVLGDQGLR